MELNQKSSNLSDLTCLFNNGLSLVTSKDSLMKRLNLCDSQFKTESRILDFNHVCSTIISNNEKSILKCKYTYKKKSRDLISGYEVNRTRFSHDPNKVIFNFSLYILTEHEKSLKGLGFLYHLKRFIMLTFLHNLNCYIGAL